MDLVFGVVVIFDDATNDDPFRLLVSSSDSQCRGEEQLFPAHYEIMDADDVNMLAETLLYSHRDKGGDELPRLRCQNTSLMRERKT